MKGASNDSRLYAHKAQCGIRVIKEALMELEACRQRFGRDRQLLALAKETLNYLNLTIHVIVVTDER